MTGHVQLSPGEAVRMDGLPFPDKARFIYADIDGTRLRLMLLPSYKEAPRGSVIISPGRAEFCEKYFETADEFRARGFTVLVIDHRGQGLSDRILPNPIRGSYISDFGVYIDDMQAIIDAVEPDLPRPHLLYAHSMGGCVALYGMMRGSLRFDAAVLSTPMVGVVGLEQPLVTPIMSAISKLGAAKRPIPFRSQKNGMPAPFPNNKHTSDRRRYGIWRSYFDAAPRLRVGGPTFGWLAAAGRAMKYIDQHVGDYNVPSLVLNAGSDRIVMPCDVEKFARRAGTDYFSIGISRHEIYMEKDDIRSQMWEAIDVFLDKQAI